MGAALIDICSVASRRLSKLDLAPMLSSRNPKRGKIHRISGAGSWLYCISWVRDPIGTLKCSNEKLKVLEKKSGVPANCALRYIHSKKEFVQGGVFPAGLLWTWCTSSSTTKIPSGEIERRQHIAFHISALRPRTCVKPSCLSPPQTYLIRMCVGWQVDLFNRQREASPCA